MRIINRGAFLLFDDELVPPRQVSVAVERPRQAASTGDAISSIVDHNPIFMVGTDEAAGELRMLEDAQRTLEQKIRM